MKNGFDIEWTFDAEESLNEIFDYLYFDKAKTVRRCVLSPQTSIYYRKISVENKIVIITLFDNRRHPDLLKI